MALFNFFYILTHSRKISTLLLAAVFFPGTVIHELSHALMAGILFVPVARIELVPQLQGEYIKLGSVEMKKTDIVRSFFVGVAPVLFGSSLLIFAMYYLSTSFSIFRLAFDTGLLIRFLLLYVIFVTANTMFSSRKDMEGALKLLLIMGIVGMGLLFADGAWVTQRVGYYLQNSSLLSFTQKIDLLLLFPTGINIIFAVLFSRKRY